MKALVVNALGLDAGYFVKPRVFVNVKNNMTRAILES
jgi:hypothetical protein